MDLDRLRRNWENLGRADPMWAILTNPGTEGGRWDEAEFFATGVHFVRWVGDWLYHNGIPIPSGRALDFGCGIGRLTQALAPYFDEVTGVDISQPMIDLAVAKNRHGDKVRYVCNTSPDLEQFATGSFDYVQTLIVLQHMRPEYSLRYVAEFLRVLRRGGLLFFQLATRPRSARAGTMPSSDEQPGEARMEMYGVAPERVREVLAAHGGTVLKESENPWAGPTWRSMHFVVRRA